MHVISAALFLATSSSKTKPTSSAASLLPLLFFVGIGFVLWRFYLKPRQQAAQSQRQAMSALEVGDEVITTAGIFGTVVNLQPDRVTLEVGPSTEITLVRNAIAKKVDVPPPTYDSDDDDDGHYGADGHELNGHGGDEHDEHWDEDEDDHDTVGHADHDTVGEVDHESDDGPTAAAPADDTDESSPASNGAGGATAESDASYDPFESAVPRRRKRRRSGSRGDGSADTESGAGGDGA